MAEQTESGSNEALGGIVLIGATLLALVVANSPLAGAYDAALHAKFGLSVLHWINDGLMAVFFLLIGLELEREIYVGELSSVRSALLPAIGALGGMAVPALIYGAFNAGLPTQDGFGIPMATDIAFALCVMALLGDRVPVALKVFLVAFAVMDDLGAILIIAIFYSTSLSIGYLGGALGVWAGLIALNRIFRVMAPWPYLIGGMLLWALMLGSGVHATLAGVLLAFAIPFSGQDNEASPSHRVEHFLHKPVAFFVLPVFALANTAIVIDDGWRESLLGASSLGISAGLLLGKPLGVAGACLGARAMGLCRLPEGVTWLHLAGAGFLGGIGFTMSIFITDLAFPAAPGLVASAKMAVLWSSLVAGLVGYSWLRVTSARRK